MNIGCSPHEFLRNKSYAHACQTLPLCKGTGTRLNSQNHVNF